MNALTLSATRRRNKVVILGSLAVGSPSESTTRTALRYAAASLFSLRTTAVVVAVTVCALLWHNATGAPDTAAAVDAAVAMPWLAVFAVRTSRHAAAMMQKGGAA